MIALNEQIKLDTSGQGLYEFTDLVDPIVSASQIEDGLCTLFISHTSASLTIQENADPSAKYDLESWIKRFIPENDPHYTHTFEGVDDMPAHIKAAITSTSLGIPVVNGKLALGVWQGIYLWEHRSAAPSTKNHC